MTVTASRAYRPREQETFPSHGRGNGKVAALRQADRYSDGERLVETGKVGPGTIVCLARGIAFPAHQRS